MSKQDQWWLLFVVIYFALAVPGFAAFHCFMFSGLRNRLSQDEWAALLQRERETRKRFFWTLHGGMFIGIVLCWLLAKMGWTSSGFFSHPAMQTVIGILLGSVVFKVIARVFPLRAEATQLSSPGKDDI